MRQTEAERERERERLTEREREGERETHREREGERETDREKGGGGRVRKRRWCICFKTALTVVGWKWKGVGWHSVDV